jgi:hypothetical protein
MYPCIGLNLFCLIASDVKLRYKPRRRRFERLGDESDRKAFRLLMFEDQVDQLLDPSVWPAGVRVCEWVFKSDLSSAASAPPAASSPALNSNHVPPAAVSASPPADLVTPLSDLGNSAPGSIVYPPAYPSVFNYVVSSLVSASVVMDVDTSGTGLLGADDINVTAVDFSTLTASDFSSSGLQNIGDINKYNDGDH